MLSPSRSTTFFPLPFSPCLIQSSLLLLNHLSLASVTWQERARFATVLGAIAEAPSFRTDRELVTPLVQHLCKMAFAVCVNMCSLFSSRYYSVYPLLSLLFAFILLSLLIFSCLSCSGNAPQSHVHDTVVFGTLSTIHSPLCVTNCHCAH